MARYLDRGFFEPILALGKAIECFLGAGTEYGGEPTVRWVSVRRNEEGCTAQLYEAIDPRTSKFLDIYAFRSTTQEPDEPIAEATFDTLEEVLACARGWGADLTRFVNQSVIADEYADYLKALNP